MTHKVRAHDGQDRFSAAAADLNIRDALNDPKIFAPSFPDKETWSAWCSFLSALFGLPMSDEERATFTARTGRADPPTKPAREAWIIAGRKGGKSRMWC
jgi:hypothetical protein